MYKKFIFILVLVAVFSGCSRRENPPLEKFSQTKEFFNSVVRIDVCYSEDQKEALAAAVDQIWTRFADIHWRLSVYDPQSDLNRINSSYPNTVTVGADTYSLIKDSIYYHKLSGQLFDITIYPLLKLWKASEKKDALPTAEDIRLAQALMGVDKFELMEKNQVRLLDPNTKLSIDSIADGYAGDEAVRILRSHGFVNFLVDTTGELYGSGRNCEGNSWRVGVKDPYEFGRIIDVVQITNTAVTTSGNYEHFYTVGGKKYSHIIDPKTGFPHNEIVSATVIAPSSELSDFLSTVLCVMDPQKGVDLIDSLGEGFASMVIIEDDEGKSSQRSSRNYAGYRMK